MYGMCGSPDRALEVFERMPERDVVSWNVMIAMNTQHGQSVQALQAFYEMQQKGTKPTRVTFLAILDACCSQANLIEGQVSEEVWELDFVVPSSQETLEFKFLLKDLEHSGHCVWEEGSNRLIVEGINDHHRNNTATFKFLHGMEEFDLPVTVQTESISAFALGTNWRDCKGISSGHGLTEQPAAFPVLETAVRDYEGQHPISATKDAIHDDRLAEERDSQPDQSGFVSVSQAMESLQSLETSSPGPSMPKTRSVSVQDLVVLGSESPTKTDAVTVEVDGFSQEDASYAEIRGQGGLPHVSSTPHLFLERSVCDSPKDSALETFAGQFNGDVGTRRQDSSETMARRRLAIVMVGLPARGKTFTAAKLMRYLRWLGHVTKLFNVGKYRRQVLGCNQNADFFRGDNKDGLDARNEVAAIAMNDMLAWMQEGGQIGVFDATNSTVKRRKMLLNMAEGKCKIIFLEIICNDQKVIDRNIELKILQSPDYVDVSDFEVALKDFKNRLANYEKVYEPVYEGSYIKMIDTVTGDKGQLQVNKISGYLPGRLLFFLVNTHTNPRPIFLTRDGETFHNMQGRIGGDQCLSEVGEIYAKKLADFVKEQLKDEQSASVWTSSLQRTVSTARHIVGFPKVQWRALDDINAGICEGMTYQDIEETMPEEFEARRLDKLQYRYPHGESYIDVIQRVEPVIIELERQQSPVVLVAHQAVLRSLYGYFADQPAKDIPHIEIPLHTVIVIQMGLLGVEEKRYKLL